MVLVRTRRSAIVLDVRRFALALLAVAGPACSYIFELPETDVSTTSPGAADGGGDGGPIVDAEPIVIPPDGAPVTPVPPFCASTKKPSIFCFDFDGVPVPDAASLGDVHADGGRLDIANAVSLSPPRALLSTVSGGGSAAAVVHSLDASPDAVTLSFDQLVSAWSSTAAALSYVEFVSSATRCVARIVGDGTTWSVVQRCEASGVATAEVTTRTSAPMVKRRWQRFALAVTLAPPKRVTLDIDGSRVADVAALDDMNPVPTSIGLGIDRSESGDIALFQDNVLVTHP